MGNRLAFNFECPVNASGGLLWSCNLMIEKELFFEVKGFDEDYPYASMEDVDFRNKIMIYTRFLFVKDAVVFHPWKLVENPKDKFGKALTSHLIFLNKWPDKKNQFGFTSAIRKILYNLKDDVIPNLIPYKAAGLSYNFEFYRFLFKLSLSLKENHSVSIK
jgi:GT2 family glycosyltransferase